MQFLSVKVWIKKKAHQLPNKYIFLEKVMNVKEMNINDINKVIDL